MTELVDDDRQVLPSTAHLLQQRGERLRLGDEVRGLADDLAQRRLLLVAAFEELEEILRVEQADDVVDLLAINRVARVAAVRDEGQRVVEGHAHVEGFHLVARDHHVARGAVGELEHVADHLGGLAAEETGALALLDQGFHLGLGDARIDGLLAVLLAAEALAQPPERAREREHGDLERAEPAGGDRRDVVRVLLRERGDDLEDRRGDQHGGAEREVLAIGDRLEGLEEAERGDRRRGDPADEVARADPRFLRLDPLERGAPLPRRLLDQRVEVRGAQAGHGRVRPREEGADHD